MKRLYLVFAALFISTTLWCQEQPPTYSPLTKRHSLEIYGGVPNALIMAMRPGRSSDNKELYDLGQRDKSVFPLGINVAYSFRITQRWEVQALVHLGGWLYGRYQYPNSQWEGEQYNWNSTNPVKLWNSVKGGIAPVLSARYYWYLGDSWQWYSSAGIGITPHLGGKAFPVLPNITLVGLHYGAGSWYFLAEVSGVASGMGILAGAGFRL